MWALFLRKNEDPEWKVEVAGVSLNASQRWGVLFLFSFVTFMLVSGSLIFWSSMFFCLVAAGHATIHVPPVGDELPLPGQFQASDGL